MADITNPHDRFFKETFSQPEVAADFLANYLPPEVAALLDPDPASIELTKDSFIDPDLSQNYSDLLYRVRLRDDRPAFVYVLFEHKSYVDPWVAFQLLRYMVRIWERDLRRNKRAALAPIVPLVVYHGRDAWQIAPSFGVLFAGPEELRPYWPDFAYRLTDLSLYSDAEIRGLVLLRATTLALRHIFDPQQRHRLPGILALLREIKDRETALRWLHTFARYYAEASDVMTEAQLKVVVAEAVASQGEAVMATIAETWVERGRKQGLEQGLEQGVRRGRQEGIREGVRTGLLDGIELALDLKFGAAGLALMPDIRTIDDVDTLRVVHAATITASTPEDVRAAYG